tara:strand:- start:610 stop:864 length:255 start_codon:yes stop_codon:yes gene_type:complete
MLTEDAYFYISIAYASIACLTTGSLILNGWMQYKKYRYVSELDRKHAKKPLHYVLHALHIPPYLIASYWYYDAYKDYDTIYKHE